MNFHPSHFGHPECPNTCDEDFGVFQADAHFTWNTTDSDGIYVGESSVRHGACAGPSVLHQECPPASCTAA